MKTLMFLNFYGLTEKSFGHQVNIFLGISMYQVSVLIFGYFLVLIRKLRGKSEMLIAKQLHIKKGFLTLTAAKSCTYWILMLVEQLIEYEIRRLCGTNCLFVLVGKSWGRACFSELCRRSDNVMLTIVSHKCLIDELVQPDFKASKKRIEDLITRDYLERDKENPNLFRYLAWRNPLI